MGTSTLSERERTLSYEIFKLSEKLPIAERERFLCMGEGILFASQYKKGAEASDK